MRLQYGVMLNDAAIWALRQQAAAACDADTSQLCSAALWSSGKERANARRRVGKILARKAAAS